MLRLTLIVCRASQFPFLVESTAMVYFYVHLLKNPACKAQSSNDLGWV